MGSKDYVLQYFPDAYCELDDYFGIWAKYNGSVEIAIGGSTLSADDAWEDAKEWIDQLPEENKPKIINNE